MIEMKHKPEIHVIAAPISKRLGLALAEMEKLNAELEANGVVE